MQLKSLNSTQFILRIAFINTCAKYSIGYILNVRHLSTLRILNNKVASIHTKKSKITIENAGLSITMLGYMSQIVAFAGLPVPSDKHRGVVIK